MQKMHCGCKDLNISEPQFAQLCDTDNLVVHDINLYISGYMCKVPAQGLAHHSMYRDNSLIISEEEYLDLMSFRKAVVSFLSALKVRKLF